MAGLSSPFELLVEDCRCVIKAAESEFYAFQYARDGHNGPKKEGIASVLILAAS